MKLYQRNLPPERLPATHKKRKKWSQSQNQNTGRSRQAVLWCWDHRKGNFPVLWRCNASLAASRNWRNRQPKRKQTLFLVVDRLRAETPNYLERTLTWWHLAFWALAAVLVEGCPFKVDSSYVGKGGKPRDDVRELFFNSFFVLFFEGFSQFSDFVHKPIVRSLYAALRIPVEV